MEFKGSVRCNFIRESLYGLFFLVRTVRVVRGSWNSKGVPVVILTAKYAKTAKSLSGLLLSVRTLRVVRVVRGS